MVERDASDLYATVGALPHVKIEGVATPVGKQIMTAEGIREMLSEMLSDKKLAEFDEELELDTAFSVDEIGRFRINVYRQRGEEAFVIRQIKGDIPDFKTLSLPLVIQDLIMEPRGLIIIAGATGTGKSTTVASMIDYRNQKRTGHILTIEDPIEFMHTHKKSIISQREVGIDTKSYKEALRRAMREAPDVIMIGEIRDAETMKQALSYADTGHLCIATLHATNSTQAMERVIGLFPEEAREQLLMDMSLNLRAVIAIRLLKDVSKKRTPATEVLVNEPHIKAYIREGATDKLKDALENASTGSPLHSFDNDILRLINEKRVAMEEALIHADEPDYLKLKVKIGGSISSEPGDIYGV